MIYSYRFQVVIRVIILGLLIFLCLYAAHQPQWYTTTAILAVLSAISMIELVHYTEQWRREFRKFLMSIRYRDFTSGNYQRGSRWNMPEYKFAFREITREFQQVRLEKEAHYQYIQTIIGHINTALMCFDHRGDIRFSNTAANEFFGVHQLRSLSQVERECPELAAFIGSDKTGGGLLKVLLRGKLYRLSVQLSLFKMQDQQLRLVSFRDIREELEETELESWKKLIQVLTHEIMNSATPVASLSKAMLNMLTGFAPDEKKGVIIPPVDFEELVQSMQSIENRSRGMLKFVDDYKNLSRIPVPVFEPVSINDLMKYVFHLLKPELDNRGIVFRIQITPADISVTGDHDMLQRVFLNLILNSMYALEGQPAPQISVMAGRPDSGRVEIAVQDNGRGIHPQDMDKIFIPFFSTRKGGSGLGLSISREIIRAHRGKLLVASREGEGTVFTIVL